MLDENGGRHGSLPDSKILHPAQISKCRKTSKNCRTKSFLGRGAANRGKILAEWLSVILPPATSHFQLNLQLFPLSQVCTRPCLSSRLPCYVFCICLPTQQINIRTTNQLSWAINYCLSTSEILRCLRCCSSRKLFNNVCTSCISFTLIWINLSIKIGH